MLSSGDGASPRLYKNKKNMLDKNLKLSEHFTLGELTKTSYKTPDNNEPPLEAIENLINLCMDWLEDLRFAYYH